MSSKNKVVKVKIKGWAVMNTELETPCIEIDSESFTIGSAVYFSDLPNQDKWLAQRYMKRNKLKKFPDIKIIPITLSYSLNNKRK